MNHWNEEQIKIFDSLWEKLNQYHGFMKIKPALLSYSGGKDSSILLYFFQYLSSVSRIPAPKIFHLDHRIRDNHEQEISIQKEMDSFGSDNFFFQKKYLN